MAAVSRGRSGQGGWVRADVENDACTERMDGWVWADVADDACTEQTSG